MWVGAGAWKRKLEKGERLRVDKGRRWMKRAGKVTNFSGLFHRWGLLASGDFRKVNNVSWPHVERNAAVMPPMLNPFLSTKDKTLHFRFVLSLSINTSIYLSIISINMILTWASF